MLGSVAAVGAFGAMIVGGIGFEEGVTGIVMSLPVTVAAAAKFYDQSYRTGITASAVERTLGRRRGPVQPCLGRKRDWSRGR
jgi:hypothetical protein